MKKTISTKNKIAKILTTINILFALVLSCFPVQEVKGQVFPTVYWSPSTLNITLQQGNTQAGSGSIFNPPSPPQGDIQSKIVSFYSTTALNNATLVVDPNIAPFLYNAYPQPGNLATWQRKNIFLFFRIPPRTRNGIYEGTIQIRNGNQLLPGMLKVSIKVQEPAGEQVVASATGEISSGYGSLEIPNVVSIEMLENTSRPSMNYLLEQISSPEDKQLFLAYQQSENLPAVAEDKFIKITSDEKIPGFMGIKVKVSSEILAAITPEQQPELYAEIINFGADDEEFGEWIPLRAEFNQETGELSSSLSGVYFAPSNDNTSLNTSSRMAANSEAESRVSARIRVSLTNQAPRTVPITGTFTTPSSSLIEVGIRDTITLNGNLTVKVPVSLVSPTTSDVVTDPFADNHLALDLRAADGDPISAAADGVVIYAQNQPSTGRRNRHGQLQSGGFAMRIQHDDGSTTGYAHLIENSNTVPVGTRVTSGQQIAQGDSTGGVTGPHLHLTYTVDGVRVNPQTFIGADDLPQQYLNQLSIVASIDGTPIEATRRRVTQREFNYNAPLNISALPNVQSGRTHALTINATTDNGQSVPLYTGRLRIRPNAMRVVLTWDKNDTDVDLHVRDSLGNESWYGNLCGIPNGCLDHDDVNGFGPETFSLTSFAPNVTYTVFLHYFSDHGNGPTTANVRVYVDNQLVTTRSVTLSNRQFFTIGTYPQSNQNFSEGNIIGKESNRGITVPFYKTPDRNVIEYYLEDFPNVKLRLNKKEH